MKESHQRVTLFSKNHGKIVLTAYGSKKLTSRRLSHLETGNVIKFSWKSEGEFATLSETDLLYAHSLIKEDDQKLSQMYIVLFVLNRILPEDEPETRIYAETLSFLKNLNNSDVHLAKVEAFLKNTLLMLGFMDESQVADEHFDVMLLIEGLIGRKVRL